jgi:hypothetical protein
LPRVLSHSIAKRAAVAALALIAAGPAVSQGIGLPSADTVAARMEVFNSSVPGSVYALQPWLNAQEVTVADGTVYRLTSLNPHVNSWFVLDIDTPMGRRTSYHLENADRHLWQVSLADDDGPAIRLEDDTGDVILCTPWDGELTEAEATGLPYAPLCDWSMFLRNPVQRQPHHAGGRVGLPARQYRFRRLAGEPDQGRVLRRRVHGVLRGTGNSKNRSAGWSFWAPHC